MKQDEADLRKVFVIRNRKHATAALGLSPEAGKIFSFRVNSSPTCRSSSNGRACRRKWTRNCARPFQRDIMQVV